MKLIKGLEKDFISDLQSNQIVGVDTESTGLDFFTEKLLLVQLALGENIYLLDCREFPKNELVYVFDLIKESNKLVIGQNLKYDLQVIKFNTDIILKNVHDLMFNEVLNNAGVGKPYYSLFELAVKHLGVKLDKDIGKQFLGATEITQEMLIYSALDVKHLVPIWEYQTEIQKKAGIEHIAKLENELLPLVSEMEYDGVLLNKRIWGRLDVRNSELLENAEKEIVNTVLTELNGILEVGTAYDAFQVLKIPTKNLSKKKKEILENIKGAEWIKSTLAENLNLNSPYQMPAALNLMGIPVEGYGASTLEKHKHAHPIIQRILEYKEYAKKDSSFGKNFYDYIHSITGRIHPEWHPLKVTGRFGCSDPNLQNIVRDPAYRRAFIAREDWKMITLDYSQAEYRLLGAVSEEPNIIIPYQKGFDFHTYTASLVYGVPLEEVTGKQRDRAKNINFSTAYFSTAWGLYYNYGIPVDEGRLLLRAQAKEFPIMMYFRDTFGDLVWENKYSKTPFGRVRYFQDKRDFTTKDEWNKYKRKVIREGFNLHIQGGIADILKMAMLELYKTNKYQYQNDFRILMQEHDELVIEAKEGIADEVAYYAKEVMEEKAQPFFGEIPAVVSKPLIKNSWDKG